MHCLLACSQAFRVLLTPILGMWVLGMLWLSLKAVVACLSPCARFLCEVGLVKHLCRTRLQPLHSCDHDDTCTRFPAVPEPVQAESSLSASCFAWAVS